jgi:hypothetical protein
MPRFRVAAGFRTRTAPLGEIAMLKEKTDALLMLVPLLLFVLLVICLLTSDLDKIGPF